MGQSSAHAQPGAGYDEPDAQQARQGQNPGGGWNDQDIISPQTSPQRSRVAFAPVSPPPRDTPAGADTPSSVGLGIGSVDNSGAQFPGYYTIVSRDSFQQEPDSRPTTPPLANDSSKSTIAADGHALGSLNGPSYYYPQQYDTPQPPGDHGRPRFAWWTRSRGWKMLDGGWAMYSMFLVGFGFAVGHHAFYDYLDGKPAYDQIRMMRFGGLLSYASKASLVAAVIFAYRQQIWVTVINNALRLRTIDSVFAAVNEPLALWNWEFIKKAPVSVWLAILAWLFPLTVILTPATLTVAPLTEITEGWCPGIRTLNFEAERKKNWRILERLDGVRGVSLSLWTCTVPKSEKMVDTPFNETFFDYWLTSSPPVELVVAQSAMTGAVIPRRGVALETCGAGWNCSYTISFKAPGYKCAELARGPKLDEDGLKKQGVPFNAGQLAPNGNYSYIADTLLGEYYTKQVNVSEEGVPTMDPPYPKNLGAFRTEPVLWVGHSVPTTPGIPPGDRTDKGWDSAFEATVFRCEHYLTEYTVRFNHTFSEQTTTVLKREHLRPIIDTTFVPNKGSGDGTYDNTTATPESNYVFPLDLQNYRLTAAYHSLGFSMRRYLQGTIQYTPFVKPNSEATKTSLIDPETYLPVTNLMEQVQTLYENMTLSLLSDPRFLIVSWAAKPDQRSGGGSNATHPALQYPCVKTRFANAYVYNRRDFWIAYSVAISAALMAVVLGSAALSQNNFHVRDVHVSSIVAATRAPCLEGLPWKASKWGEVPEEILETKLGYGVVAEPGPNGTPAAVSARGGLPGMWMGVGSPGPMVVSGKVYYGFAPKEELERTRVHSLGPGKPRNRLSAFSFKTWEQNY